MNRWTGILYDIIRSSFGQIYVKIPTEQYVLKTDHPQIEILNSKTSALHTGGSKVNFMLSNVYSKNIYIKVNTKHDLLLKLLSILWLHPSNQVWYFDDSAGPNLCKQIVRSLYHFLKQIVRKNVTRHII